MYFIKLREIPKLDLIGATEAKPLMCGPQNCPNYCYIKITRIVGPLLIKNKKSLLSV